MLVEFAIIVSESTPTGFRELLCIDSCNHGSVHRHGNGNHDRFAVVREMTSESDLDAGFVELEIPVSSSMGRFLHKLAHGASVGKSIRFVSASDYDSSEFHEAAQTLSYAA